MDVAASQAVQLDDVVVRRMPDFVTLDVAALTVKIHKKLNRRKMK